MLSFEVFSSKISSLKVFKGNLNDSTGKKLTQPNKYSYNIFDKRP